MNIDQAKKVYLHLFGYEPEEFNQEKFQNHYYGCYKTEELFAQNWLADHEQMSPLLWSVVNIPHLLEELSYDYYWGYGEDEMLYVFSVDY